MPDDRPVLRRDYNGKSVVLVARSDGDPLPVALPDGHALVGKASDNDGVDTVEVPVPDGDGTHFLNGDGEWVVVDSGTTLPEPSGFPADVLTNDGVDPSWDNVLELVNAGLEEVGATSGLVRITGVSLAATQVGYAPGEVVQVDAGSDSPDGTKFLRDDGTWQDVPAGGTGVQFSAVMSITSPDTTGLSATSTSPAVGWTAPWVLAIVDNAGVDVSATAPISVIDNSFFVEEDGIYTIWGRADWAQVDAPAEVNFNVLDLAITQGISYEDGSGRVVSAAWTGFIAADTAITPSLTLIGGAAHFTSTVDFRVSVTRVA
jgi:hypothetical protein